MAQTICAVVDCALVKTNGALGAPLGFSHGASMAQRRRWAQIELIDTGGGMKKVLPSSPQTGAGPFS